MVICLERDADLHMAQLMPLPLTVHNPNGTSTDSTVFVRSTVGYNRDTHTHTGPTALPGPPKWSVIFLH